MAHWLRAASLKILTRILCDAFPTAFYSHTRRKNILENSFELILPLHPPSTLPPPSLPPSLLNEEEEGKKKKNQEEGVEGRTGGRQEEEEGGTSEGWMRAILRIFSGFSPDSPLSLL